MREKTKQDFKNNFEYGVSFLLACQMTKNRGHDCKYCKQRQVCNWWPTIDSILDDYNEWKRERVNNVMEVH